MKKQSIECSTIRSPRTPKYYQRTGEQQGRLRDDSKCVLLPYNNANGRILPSKWEDAERWISSPVSVDLGTSFHKPRRQPKSKSGPLGPHDPSFLPTATDGSSIRSGPGGHGYQDDSAEDAIDAISRDVSRRDMATQMSPESSGSGQSSPRRYSSVCLLNPKSVIRDVPVDELVAAGTKWAGKTRTRINRGKCSGNSNEWNMDDVDIHSPSWGSATDSSINKVSRSDREDLKITAWENLQKAKAEAAIRKLEMKLEKKRSVSMDKITTKLKSAQKKAQEMRNSLSATHGHESGEDSNRKELALRGARKIGTLSGCFAFYAQ